MAENESKTKEAPSGQGQKPSNHRIDATCIKIITGPGKKLVVFPYHYEDGTVTITINSRDDL